MHQYLSDIIIKILSIKYETFFFLDIDHLTGFQQH